MSITEEQAQEIMDRLTAATAPVVELHPELVPWLEEDGPLGAPAIRHPLVYSLFHYERQNEWVNECYLMKKQALVEARRKRKWSSYVFLYERPYRLQAFESLVTWNRVGDQAYWSLLGQVWRDSENVYQNFDLWREMLTADQAGRKYRSHLMSPENREALRHDIDKTNGRIYRGFSSNGTPLGMSWTTNRIVAKFFAKRLAAPDETLHVATGLVDRKDIIAFFDERSEYEVLVLPENVRDVEITELAKGESS